MEKVIEKLKEAYIALNPGVEIEIIYSGSGSGITDAIEGRNDIAMSSRGLKEEELATLTEYQFASDGIAVVVSNDNPLTGLSSEQITSVFTGQTRTWDALAAE